MTSRIIQGADRAHVTSLVELSRLRDRLAELRGLGDGGEIGFDYETSGPSITPATGKPKPDVTRHMPVGYSVAFLDGECVYVPCPMHTQLSVDDRVFDDNALDFRAFAVRILRYLAANNFPSYWCHNAKFELAVSRNGDVSVDTSRILCSQIAAWLAGWRLPGKAGLKLKSLAGAYLNYRGPTFDDIAQGRDAASIPVEELAPYGANDAWLTLQLGRKARGTFDRLKLHEQWALERRVLPVTAHMEDTGVPIDRELLLTSATRCESEMGVVAAEFRRLTTTRVMLPTKVKRPKRCAACGGLGHVGHRDPGAADVCDAPGCMGGRLHFKNGKLKSETVTELQPQSAGCDVGSDAQVARWLFDELGWWPKAGHPLTDGGDDGTSARRPSTKAEHIMRYAALDGNAGAAARLRLRYQALRKYASTYTRGLVNLADQWGDGKLHTSYNQTGTDTQRYSSSVPNISNLPSSERNPYPWMGDLPDIRAAFVAPPGWAVIVMDYSQIELRLMAHYSRDPGLLAAYPFEGSGKDLHAELSAALGCPRRDAKIVRFSSLYRISAKTLARKMALGTNDWTSHTRETAGDALDMMHTLHPNIQPFWDAAIAYAKEHGYASTITGFKRPLRDWSKDHEYHTGTCAINTPIQGSAGGIIKMALADMYEEWSAGGLLPNCVRIVGQTYDEVIVVAKDDAGIVEQVKADMTRVMVAVGRKLSLRVPLAVEGGHGRTWSEAKG